MSIPTDGYYNALVQCDSGGEMHLCVEVYGGRVFMANGAQLKPETCSNFVPVSSWTYCSVWPVQAGEELDTLRTANKALVERVVAGWRKAKE